MVNLNYLSASLRSGETVMTVLFPVIVSSSDLLFGEDSLLGFNQTLSVYAI